MKPAITAAITIICTACVCVCVVMVSGAVCVTVCMSTCHRLIINRFTIIVLYHSSTVMSSQCWVCCVLVFIGSSTVNGENPGSRPQWSMHTSWTTPQSDKRALLSLDNSGLSWTVSASDKVTAVPVRRNGNFQTPISVPAVRPKRCHTLSNPAHRQDYTVACLNYTLQTMMPLPGWPVMAPNAYNNNNIGLWFC